MKRPIWLIALLFFLGLGIGIFYYLTTTRYQVVITQEQIDKTLRSKFPFTKTVLVLFQIQYSNPKVTLLPKSDRVQISIDVDLVSPSKEGENTRLGTLVATTGIRYDAETRQFYLANIELQTLTLIGVSQNKIEKAMPLISKATQSYLEKHSVYTIVDKNAKTKLARMLLKEVKVTHQELHVTLGLN